MGEWCVGAEAASIGKRGLASIARRRRFAGERLAN